MEMLQIDKIYGIVLEENIASYKVHGGTIQNLIPNRGKIKKSDLTKKRSTEKAASFFYAISTGVSKAVRTAEGEDYNDRI